MKKKQQQNEVPPKLFLNVFGLKIPVILKPIENKSLAGFYDLDKKEIVISAETSEKTHTLVHEMFHAALFRTSFNQTGIPHEVHEIVVDVLATALLENFDLLNQFRKEFDSKDKK